MPDVSPFRGVRYDVARVGTLSDVVAPPYDVIDPPLQDRLYQASPYNIIRLELNRQEPGDTEAQGRSCSAPPPVLEGLATRGHPPPGGPYRGCTLMTRPSRSTGCRTPAEVSWRVRLEPMGEGRIYPHEQTLAGPKADRLALYHATGFNLSPVFGLYPDAEGEVLRSIEAGLRDRTPLVATDHLGVENRLWVVDDFETHTAVRGLMASKPILRIADGHHRYETGLQVPRGTGTGRRSFRRRRPVQLLPHDAGGLERPRPLDPADPPAGLGPPWPHEAEQLSSPSPARIRGADRRRWRFRLSSRLGRDRAQWRSGHPRVRHRGRLGQWLVARLRSDDVMDRLAPEHSPDWRSLGVSILHVLVLDSLLKPLGAPACRYVHLLQAKSLTTWPRAAVTLPASSPRPGWKSMSNPSPRDSKPCRPRARTSIPSS